MKPETLQALKGSIRKWEQILAGEGEDNGTSNCPLCERFAEVHSLCFLEEPFELCPVNAPGCEGTPYHAWTQHHSEVHKLEDFPFHIVDKCCIPYAQAELDFLKSLLPEGEK